MPPQLMMSILKSYHASCLLALMLLWLLTLLLLLLPLLLPLLSQTCCCCCPAAAAAAPAATAAAAAPAAAAQKVAVDYRLAVDTATIVLLKDVNLHRLCQWLSQVMSPIMCVVRCHKGHVVLYLVLPGMNVTIWVAGCVVKSFTMYVEYVSSGMSYDCVNIVKIVFLDTGVSEYDFISTRQYISSMTQGRQLSL